MAGYLSKQMVRFGNDKITHVHAHVHNPDPREIVVGLAYGPEYACGITAFNVYQIKYNFDTKQLYVVRKTGDEPINHDGTVEGGHKKYKVAFKSS
jgi:hypothetical protein